MLSDAAAKGVGCSEFSRVTLEDWGSKLGGVVKQLLRSWGKPMKNCHFCGYIISLFLSITCFPSLLYVMFPKTTTSGHFAAFGFSMGICVGRG